MEVATGASLVVGVRDLGVPEQRLALSYKGSRVLDDGVIVGWRRAERNLPCQRLDGTVAGLSLTAFKVVLLGRMRSLSFQPSPTDLAAAEAATREIGVAELAARRLGELSGWHQAGGLTTIAVLHDLNAAARFAARVAVLHAGQLVGTGLPGDVLCPAMLEPAFAVRVAIDQGSDGYPVVLPLRAIRP